MFSLNQKPAFSFQTAIVPIDNSLSQKCDDKPNSKSMTGGHGLLSTSGQEQKDDYLEFLSKLAVDQTKIANLENMDMHIRDMNKKVIETKELIEIEAKYKTYLSEKISEAKVYQKELEDVTKKLEALKIENADLEKQYSELLPNGFKFEKTRINYEIVSLNKVDLMNFSKCSASDRNSQLKSTIGFGFSIWN